MAALPEASTKSMPPAAFSLAVRPPAVATPKRKLEGDAGPAKDSSSLMPAEPTR